MSSNVHIFHPITIARYGITPYEYDIAKVNVDVALMSGI